MKIIRAIRYSLLLTFMVTAVVFTGCVNTEENIIIKKDGSASVDLHINIDREAYIKECLEGEDISEEDIQTIDENMEAQGATLVTIDGKDFYRMSIVEQNKLNNKELLSEFYVKDTVAYMTGGVFYWNTSAKAIYTDKLSELKLDELGITMGQLMQVPLNISVQFSKDIVEQANGVVDDDNAKKVFFTLEGDKKKTLFASTSNTATLKSIEADIKALNKTETSKVLKLQPKNASKKAKKATISFKIKGVKTTNGYQLQYGTRRNFKNARTKTVKRTSGTITNLKRKTKYYVRVRVRKSNYAGVNVYGKWSSMKTVRTR